MSTRRAQAGLKIRFGVVVGAIIIGLAGAWLKLGTLQIYKGSGLSQLAHNQSLSEYEARSPRGNVYDRNGYLLAASVSLNSIFVQPNKLANPSMTAIKLANATGLNRKELTKKLQSDRPFVFIKRRVSPKISAQVAALKLGNVGFISEEKRFYPNHALLGQVLGLVSIDGVGLSGIEKAFDETLKGTAYRRKTALDARGRHLDIGESHTPPNGGNVYLTIDQGIQFIAEESLKIAMRTHRPRAAWAIVMDIPSGDLLAVANFPRLNPNAPGLSSEESPRNSAFSSTYEPGSVFKMVTFAAALDAEVVSPADQIFCENGHFKIGRFTIRDVTKKEWLSATDVFVFSSNIGTMKIADKLGEKKLFDAIKQFGFGVPTGLSLAEEATGSIPKLPWRTSRLANVSFGYGLTATALQMASFAATVANGGRRVTPNLIFKIEGARAPLRLARKNPEQVLGGKAARQLTQMMVATTQIGAFGQRAHIAGMEVAGKSGTTEKLDSITKTYNKKKNIASFIGFAPAFNPKIAVLVVIDEPQDASFGGVVAAPVWRDIVRDTLMYQGNLF